MDHKTRNLFLVLAALSLAAIACNLSSTSTAPPTIVPRSALITPTPQPTLGYATQAPGVAPIPTAGGAGSPVEVEMFNMLNQVEEDRLYIHVQNLVNFHTRHVNSSTTSIDRGVGAAYEYIMGQLLTYQDQSGGSFMVFPDGHPFEATWDGKTSIQRNAVAILRGTDAGAGVIVLGAHYDSRANDDTDSESYAPGAVDNGSGVAALLELSRVLSRYPQRATVMFVFFAAEEVNRQGSRAFVEDYIEGQISDSEVIMINVDTIGNWNDSNGTINDWQLRLFSPEPNDSPSRQLARSLEFIGEHYGMDLSISLQDQIDREGRYGDHFSFVEAGYPAVRFIEALEDTSSREGRDTIDGLEPLYLKNATKTILGVVMSLAGGPRPPQNISLRDEGNGMWSLIWETVPEASQYIIGLQRPGSLEINHHFIEDQPRAEPWDRYGEFEALYVASVDSRGLIGPFSRAYKIP